MMEHNRPLCVFCGWQPPVSGDMGQKQLKEHYQASHHREITENRIKKWGAVGCLKCTNVFTSPEELVNYRFCPRCGYNMSAWFAGMMAFISWPPE